MPVTKHTFQRRGVLQAALATAALAGIGASLGQGANARIIVPAAAGGATDLLSRLYAQWLGEEWGRPVVAENRPGAGGVIGSQVVAKAAPDGNTLMLGALSHVANSGMMDNVPYDPIKDFTPIAKLLTFGSVLVVHPSIPVTDLKSFIAHVKANPGKLTWALGATGTSQHLAGFLLAKQAGLSWVTVPYKGGGPVMTDLLGNQVDSSFMNINTALPQIKAGKLRPLVITSAKRSPVLPDVPTLEENGIKECNVYSWQAIAGPKGLPADVKKKLHTAVVDTFNDAAVKTRLTDLGYEIVASTPEQFTAFQATEFVRWKKLIEARNIKAD